MAQPPPEAAGGGGGGRERSARSPPRSAAWNGDCGPEPPEDDGNEEGDGDGASAPDGPGPCGCRGERAAPRAPPPRDGSCALGCRRRTEPGPEEGDEDPGRATRRLRRRQRPRSAPKEKEESGRGRRGGGARLKALLEAALSPLCSCLSAGIGGTAPGGVRGWTRRVGLRAARGLRAGGELALRLLWMLCALLLLLLVLLLGALRLCWRLLAAGVSALGRTRLAELLDSAVLRRTRGFLGVNGTWWRLWARWRRWRSAPEELRAGDAVPGCDVGAPGSSAEEVSRLLAMAEVPEEELNPFQALGVETTASDAELRKAYRRLAVLVHPDKSEHPRAEEAFKVLRAAWDIVSSPEKRKEYEMKRMAESELSRSVSEFLSRLQDDLKEAMNTMMCSKCQGKHRRFEMDRDPLSARYCAECSQLHPAEEGDLWAESSLLGLKITYFAVMDGKVYDITEWAGCQRVGICPDTHRVPYHISFGVRSSGAGGRQSRSTSKGSPSSAADLQDFFTRVFQGTSGQVPGGFPPPPAPTAPQGATAGTTRTEGAAPKSDTKHKRRKKVRRPFQR
ncbi:dnaJ homolog subfamily C member 14 isoform X1 [Tympanuchus pallidicinctus]|uniref:dnaJ homolog subfamily C member 14 isoform X1 n=1 Tax=Tympanuchus pallidicinctus TaxID=109042 RepID=UPI00228725E6|nr:dnaJ homolog subfamily C member 14 isoform X1 [Tympanuchus pallidicinctus]XP_052558839.1 dnaJ homolog subfamily C member 14 isoform X1 [Tympanuchus pallidicinctus]